MGLKRGFEGLHQATILGLEEQSEGLGVMRVEEGNNGFYWRRRRRRKDNEHCAVTTGLITS